jgi:hypothetical protein
MSRSVSVSAVATSTSDDDDDNGTSTPTKQPPRRGITRLMTAHQIGTVFESASGRRLPARVESTRMSLEQKITFFVIQRKSKGVMATYPPWEAAMDSRWMFGRRRLKDQFP